MDTEESGVVGTLPPAPPNLKRKSAGEPLAAGPPDLKKRSVDPSEALSALSLFSVNDACMVLIFR